MCQKLKCLNLSISNVVHANGYYKTIPKVICRVGIRKKITTWAVFMAQLVSEVAPEICSSKSDIGDFYCKSAGPIERRK